MFDNENLNPEENIQSNSEQVEETQSVESSGSSENKNPQPVQTQETPAERNFRALVEKNRRLERERDEAIRLAQEKNSAQIPEEADEDIIIGQDELAEGKHIKSITKKLQKMEQKLRQYEQKSSVMSEEAMLKAQYPDIDKVVSKENLQALRDADPEFAEMLDTSTSFRAKAISAYKQIKKYGIYVEDNYKSDREIAQRNASKPKPLVSVSPQQGDSPLSHANAFANGLTPELKSQLIKEMEEARKNL